MEKTVYSSDIHWGRLMLCTLGTLGVCSLIAFFAGAFGGFGAFVRPAYMPPDIVFVIVLPVLYLLTGLSLYFVLAQNAYTPDAKRYRAASIVLWFVQIAVGLAFPFFYFIGSMYITAFILIALQTALTLSLTILNFKVSAPAGFLLLPYLVCSAGMVYIVLMTAILTL